MLRPPTDSILSRVRRALPLLLLPLLAACVERKLLIRTDPPGAAIRVNGTGVGVSPVEWTFEHYGDVLVEADLPRYEPHERVVTLGAPWYQAPVVDFFADVVWPGRVSDRRELLLVLEPVRPMTQAEADARRKRLVAEASRRRAEARSK